MALCLADILVSAAVFAVSFCAASAGYYIFSGALLILLGTGLFAANAIRKSTPADPAALFSLSWLSGAGVSALKLSRLQDDWCVLTWIIIFLAYACFAAGCAAASCWPRRSPEPEGSDKAAPDSGTSSVNTRRALLCAVNIVTFLSLASFAAEAMILGYIPLFTSDTPHAYSYFHVSGLHYFTVSCVLALPLIVLYRCCFKKDPSEGLALRADLIFCSFCSLALPVLMVSRYELIFSLGLSVMVLLSAGKRYLPGRLSPRHLAIIAAVSAAFVCVYVFITYERAHSVSYLNSIYEMKSESIPIFVSQPYIYIANNFDNLNCLIEGLTEHSGGLRMLYPLFALTGLKFRYGELLSFPLYLTKEELTTVTIAYDAYYDFGIPGVMCFMLLLGAASAWIGKAAASGGMEERLMLRFVYAELLFYLALSFFTTWFSNPTTWFYFAASAAMGVFIRLYPVVISHLEGGMLHGKGKSHTGRGPG